ncbi:MAG TPA: peptidoglycan editing factor PgeF [Candidatus Acidoferrum sp.]|nr:peptidoglycan editing factor PgeF [Candidatus Acidoferrum sp.]
MKPLKKMRPRIKKRVSAAAKRDALGHKPNIRARADWKELRAGTATILQAKPLTRIKWIVHGFSTREGGSSKLGSEQVLNLGFTDWDSRPTVESNRKRFLDALGAGKLDLAVLRQIHSDVIHTVERSLATPLQGDALISNSPGIILGVQTADCVPILLADTRNRAVAAIHAGWRGTLSRIAAKTIGRMQMEFGARPADIVAAIGPAIHRCSYEVGPEVAQAFAGQFPQAREWFDIPRELSSGMRDGEIVAGEGPNPLKWLLMTPPGHDPPPPTVQLDLVAANRWQLTDAGVCEVNISASDLCTACHTDLLFSHRREQGHTGRMMAAIGIRV